MFSQILKLVPRLEFEELVRQTQAERNAKGLSSWSQFVAMMFCQLGRAHSLERDQRRSEELRGQARAPGD